MRAIQVRETGGPEVLTVSEVPDPEPGAGELLIDVAVAGVNYIDINHRAGRYPMDLPIKIGLEGTGTIRALGTGVTGFAVGERVAWPQTFGSYAEQIVAPAGRVIKVPDGVDDEVASTLLQTMTAQYLVHDSHQVRPGETVLVHAAAGGMGLLLTQWATALGARVIGTVSTEAKEKLAREAGAAEVIRYTEVEFAPEVRRLTGGKGVQAVYDGVGKTTFDGSLASVAPLGSLVVYGQASGPVPPIDLARLAAAGGIFLSRPSLGNYVVEDTELARRGQITLDAIRTAAIRPLIGARYPLADAAKAHDDLESRRTTGKLLLFPR
ncbi:MAG TPA: quinone oxidoreductase [Pseudonocardiaceae bacterium]|jgi:NADPH2:quinone reductase|nr:quinone oxidoreductase [Pseudonocardiaceae bacterium]